MHASFARVSAFNSHLRRCRRTERKLLCRLTKEESSLSAARHRERAPKRGQEARSAFGSGMRDPLVSPCRFSLLQKDETSNLSRRSNAERTLTHFGARSVPDAASRAGDEFFPRRIFAFLERLNLKRKPLFCCYLSREQANARDEEREKLRL